ncbi:Protein 5NUC [Amphibalanus amphitrite]|uniref:5'-nucleotidase n=1 Tax=Amphibalanus amphitrite TaxID=1232801 RepID=A0A6A4X1M8_AMPAM|nr:Protein 5NUC [Amphibalanus amphitrite]
MIKHMPYTALTLGDAEFTDGIDGLVPFLRAIGEIFVCTNIDFSGVANVTLQEELRRLCPRHRIVSYDSLLGPRHVCLLGYTTPLTQKLMFDKWAHFENEEEALTREIKQLRVARPEVKIFVALGHSGYERDKQIAHRVPSLDVIIGGHSHTLLWPNIRNRQVAGVPDDPHDQQFAKDVYPTTVIQPSGRVVLIAQMYKHGKYLGVLNVTFNADDEVTDFYTGPVLLTDEMSADAETENSLDKYRQEMRRRQQQVIGSTRVELVGSVQECTYTECNLGNLMTDAMLWHVRHYGTGMPHTLAAVVNAGAIKRGIKPGKFKMADITASLPYPDTLNIVKVRGSTVRKMLEHSLDENKEGIFLQISGMRVRYNMTKPLGERVVSVRILCQTCVTPEYEPLNDTTIYHIAMFTFLAVGNDGFTMLKQEMLSSQQRHDVSLDIVLTYVRRFSPLHPYLDGRIDIVTEPVLNNTATQQYSSRTMWVVAVAAGGAVLSAMLLV